MSRRAALVKGALLAHLTPKLAADAQSDLNPILAALTRANWPTSKASLLAALKPKLASDADVESLVSLLDSLEDEDPGEDEDKPEFPPKGAPVAAAPASTDAGPIDAILSALRGKLSDDDLAEIEPMLRGLKLAGDQDKKNQRRTPRHRRPAPRPHCSPPTGQIPISSAVRQWMREVVKQAVKDAEDVALRRMRAVADAESFVMPWVGRLAVEQRRAVYRAALDTLGIHPSAFRAILDAQPKLGMARACVAMDSAAIKQLG